MIARNKSREYFRKDEWLIAGVLSGGTTLTSEYGDISWWMRTQEHRSFIEQLGGELAYVPEPSSALVLITVGALGASMVGLAKGSTTANRCAVTSLNIR